MMKHHGQQQHQQQTNGGSGHLQAESKWWYKGPDGETYGPYTPREMLTWNNSGYFADPLPIKNDLDEMFHSIGEWTALCGGASPFTNPSVPAFNLLASHRQNAYMMLPPGLPAPTPFGNGTANGAAATGPTGPTGARYAAPAPYGMPNGTPAAAAAAAAAQMANLHIGAGTGAHMGMHPQMHHSGGPLSQPPSEPNEGPNSSSHTPDSAEQDFRSLHQMGPPVPSMHGGRIAYAYAMQQQQLQQQQAAAAAAAAAPPAAHAASNGQILCTRSTSTQDAPWNSRREVAVDASQRQPPRTTMSTQTLPIILGSKDASAILTQLTGYSIVIS